MKFLNFATLFIGVAAALSPTTALAGQATREVNSRGGFSRPFTNRRNSDVSIVMTTNNTIRMSTDSRQPVDADGYQDPSGRPFASNGIAETVLWAMHSNANGNSLGPDACRAAGGISRTGFTSIGVGYYECHQPIGANRTIILFPGETLRFYVRDNYKDDNSGGFLVNIFW